MPFIFSEQPNLTVTDAFFESFSGLTTTGATTLVGLDSLPHAILFYRQMLQWFGGMGIIVLAVAILPILGVGDAALPRGNAGPLKDNKMRPRIAETAKTLWLIYVLLDRLRIGALVLPVCRRSMRSGTVSPPSPSAVSRLTMPASAISTAR